MMKDAVDFILKGTTYRNAEAAMNATVQTAAGVLATAYSVFAAINPPTPAGNATFLGAINTFIVAWAGAIATFESAVANSLSLISRVE